MAALVINLSGTMKQDPATGRWRATAMDTRRSTMYLTGADHAGDTMRNLRDLITTQYPGHPHLVVVSNLEIG